jgi:hypothetical protein
VGRYQTLLGDLRLSWRPGLFKIAPACESLIWALAPALGELIGIETLESSLRAAVVEAQPDCGTHSNLRMGQDLTTGSTVNRLIP